MEKHISLNWFFVSNSLPNRSRDVPGSPGTRGPRSRDKTGQDLETLKVPWSRCPGTKEVQKSLDLKMGKVVGKMPTLVFTNRHLYLGIWPILVPLGRNKKNLVHFLVLTFRQHTLSIVFIEGVFMKTKQQHKYCSAHSNVIWTHCAISRE